MFTSIPRFQEPILFLIFNRPDTTSRVFEVIRTVKPSRLYVAADGPRPNFSGEAEIVESVRNIATAVDWPCEVKTLFRDINLGCKLAVSSAIDWFFENEEHGIILEDDCLPCLSFFGFCESMLHKYYDTKNVWMICGFNPKNVGLRSQEYFLSHNPAVWGWATWRDRWSQYKVKISEKDFLFLRSKNNLLPPYVVRHYLKAFSKVSTAQIDTWDYQLVCLILRTNGCVVKPLSNLVSNIGIEGSHSLVLMPNHNVQTCDIDYNSLVLAPQEKGYMEDQWFYEMNFKHGILLKVKSRLKKVFSIFKKGGF